ncbi:MAG: PAS domain S-box protein [Gammaproteobacteria bacterium]|nr:PAS domain S-box protein [Gammaproteobacteria bacterium]
MVMHFSASRESEQEISSLFIHTLIFTVLFAISTEMFAEEHIRVGIYPNPPLSMPGKKGVPTGFIVDVLNRIAEQERWTLEYQTCTWDSCNELLTLGQIDMLAPIAKNDAEDRRFDYNRESLYVNWGQIVTKAGDELDSPLDLEGKNVVAISSDVHFADLKALAERYDIPVRFLEVDDPESVLAWVAEGPADAGLVSRSFDISHFEHFPLVKSPVIFNPAEIRIALSPRNGQLPNALRVQRIDYHLADMKGNSNSLYYQLQDRWFSGTPPGQIPVWVFWVFFVIAIISLLLAIGVLVLRRQVRHQTQEIRRIMDRFAAFMTHLPGIAYMKDAEGRYVFVNPTWEQTELLASANVIGRTPAEIWQDEVAEPHGEEERQVLRFRNVMDTVERRPWDGHARSWRMIRFPVEENAGQSTMVGGIGLDISAQKEAEDDHSRLSRQLQLLLESAGDGIFGLDGLGQFNFVNHTALRIWGYRQEEVIGKKYHDLIEHTAINGEVYPEASSPIYQAVREGRKSRVSNEFFWHADGAPIPVEYSVHPIGEGDYPGAVVVFREQ